MFGRLNRPYYFLTATGWKPIEEIVAGDVVLSRSEQDVNAPVGPQTVQEAHQREGEILTLTVNGKEINTTTEHPFWVKDKGWVEACDLQVGDELSTTDNRWFPIDQIRNDGTVTTVYNMTVRNWHTYFVGAEDWGFDIWVHNNHAGFARVKPRLDNGNLKEGWEHIDARHISGNHPNGPGDLFAPGTTRLQIEKAAEKIVEKGARISDPSRTLQTFERRITINKKPAVYRVVVDSTDGNRIITMFPVLGGH